MKLQRNLMALVEFSRTVNQSLDLDFTLNNLLFSCMGKFLTTKGLVILNREGTAVIRSAKGIPNEEIEKFNTGSVKFGGEEEIRPALPELGESIILPISSSRGELGCLVLGEKITKKDYTTEETEFLKTVINIAATAVENALIIAELKEVNRNLDGRINRLSSLFELSKEFGLLSDERRISKLLAYSLLGHFLSSIYAIIYFEEGHNRVIDTTVPKIKEIVEDLANRSITTHHLGASVKELHPDLSGLKIELVVPMKIQNETKGLILLGKRGGAYDYEETDIEFIYSIGSLAIISLENKHLFMEALEKQKLEEELELAKDIQKNLLPKSIPEMKFYDIAATSISSKQVGGDYYDIIRKDDTNYYIAIGDVSGKGVPASLLMANLQAFLKSICRQEAEISSSTGIINDLVSENTTDGRFITFFWGIVNDETRSFTYVNAGHNPPLLVRAGEIRYLDKGGIILGVMPTMLPYASETIELQQDDLLVLFTDGVTEAKSPEDEEFTDEALEALVKSITGLPANKVLERITEEVNKHANGAMQSDDITVIVIKVK
ncbi:MAG: SpoIIE family protein phosphatase [Ignavibacteria bacterium]|nr:SpoIIE family protein phosphatase [Ignavibacteria bacterium]